MQTEKTYLCRSIHTILVQDFDPDFKTPDRKYFKFYSNLRKVLSELWLLLNYCRPPLFREP